jgi:maltooligosyltrehalose trehalohydrolase
LGERTSTLASFEMQKLLAGAVMISPYLPMLFMGEEWSEPNPFLYFVSHTDPQLAEAVRKGRKEEFAAFHIEGEAPDPMDEQTFQQSKLQWNLLAKEPHATMLRYYRQLIRLRKEQPCLRIPDRENLQVDCDPSSQSLIIKRHCKKEEVLVFMNFSKHRQSVDISHAATAWRKLLASSDKEWLGAETAPERLEPGATAHMEPESIAIYTNQQVTVAI